MERRAPHGSGGPWRQAQGAEAIAGRLEHLRGTTFGSGNLINDRLRSLLETGGHAPDLLSFSRGSKASKNGVSASPFT